MKNTNKLLLIVLLISFFVPVSTINSVTGDIIYVDVEPDLKGPGAESVWISNDYAYVAHGDTGIVIIDVTDPKNPGEPIIISSPIVWGSIKEVWILNNFLYYLSAWGETELGILDISDPVNPIPRSATVVGAANGFHVTDNWVYVASGMYSSDPSQLGFSVVDISDPFNPVVYPPVYTAGYAWDIFVQGSYAYIAEKSYPQGGDDNGGMSIFDISDPENPTFVGRVITGAAHRVTVIDDYAYLSVLGGLYRINVANPNAPGEPIPVETLSTFPSTVVREYNYLFVADDGAGLTIIDNSDPHNPGPPTNIDTTGNSVDVWISGDYAFVADGASGLAIIEISDYTLPSIIKDKDQAIVDGIAWLVNQQDPDHGFWEGEVGVTAFVLIKLQDYAFEQGVDPFDIGAYEYAPNVIEGWRYLLENLIQDDYGLSIQNATYDTGISLMTFAASGMPNRVNMFGYDFNGDAYADTFGELAQEVVNWLSYAQIDDGASRGGWGYEANGGSEKSGDNSVSGYAVLGLAAAEDFRCIIPANVMSELDFWITKIQDPVDGDPWGNDGGSWYHPYYSWVNVLKTGNLIFQMTFFGNDPSTARFQDAIDYIERHFFDTNLQPGWGYNQDISHYQAMYCLMKGLDYSDIEILDISGSEVNWYQEFCTTLLAQQISDEVFTHWPNSPCYVFPGGEWGQPSGEVLSTVWALLTLEKITPPTVIPIYVDIKPSSWPNPIYSRNQGVMSVAICGIADLDVMDIDPTTVTISREGITERVFPLRWSYEDVATPFTGPDADGHELGGDGILDLVFHFDQQEVVTTLALIDHQGESLPLFIRGTLYDEAGGTIIWGQDYVRILGKLLLGTERLVIAIDRTHDADWQYDFFGIQQHLLDLGAVVYTIGETFHIPDGTNILLLPAVRESYSSLELSYIYDWYYSDGPRLLWIAGNSDFNLNGNYFSPNSSNELLETLGSNLRLSADAISDDIYNDGASYCLAAPTPFSDGKLNSIFTEGVESAIFHGPTSVLGFDEGSIVDLRTETLKGVEVIIQASDVAYAHDIDSSASDFDYYTYHDQLGNYSLMAIEDNKANKYIITSGEVIFSDSQKMYDLYTAQGVWNDGYHEGKVLVDNIFNWFGSLPDLGTERIYDIPTEEFGQRIKVYDYDSMTLESLSQSFILHGWDGLDLGENEASAPVQVHLFIDGNEIPLNSISYTEVIDGEVYFTYFFYQSFNAEHFASGVYEWTVIWTEHGEEVYSHSFPLSVLAQGHRLNIFNPDSMTIGHLQRAFVKHGLNLNQKDFREHYPVDVVLLIDGNPLDLQVQYEVDWSDEDNPIHKWRFYKSFSPGFFEPGSYDWSVLWYTKQGLFWEEHGTLTVQEDLNRLSVFDPSPLTFYASERTYIQHGLRFSFDNMDAIWEGLPVQLQVVIGGNEIEMLHTTVIVWEDPNPYRWLFYHCFEEYYFTPGTYDYTVTWFLNGVFFYEASNVIHVLES